MRAIQFFKVDMMRCKAQLKYMAVFAVIAFFLTFQMEGGALFSFCYMLFCGVILSGQPFLADQVSESGFLNMLPGSKKERVMGRYLLAFSYLFLGGMIGVLIVFVVGKIQGVQAEGIEIMVPAAFGIGMFMVAIQNILLYAIGKGKSTQVLSVIRLLPGFIGFFGGISILDEVQENPAELEDLWVLRHPQEAALLVLAVGVVCYIAAVYISAAIIRNRDFD